MNNFLGLCFYVFKSKKKLKYYSVRTEKLHRKKVKKFFFFGGENIYFYFLVFFL